MVTSQRHFSPRLACSLCIACYRRAMRWLCLTATDRLQLPLAHWRPCHVPPLLFRACHAHEPIWVSEPPPAELNKLLCIGSTSIAGAVTPLVTCLPKLVPNACPCFARMHPACTNFSWQRSPGPSLMANRMLLFCFLLLSSHRVTIERLLKSLRTKACEAGI